MMNFIVFTVCAATEFTFSCFEPFFKRITAMQMHDCDIRNGICPILCVCTIGFFGESGYTLSLLSVIRNTPTLTIRIFIPYLFQTGFMLRGKGLQAALLHKKAKVMQIMIVACKVVIIADSSNFRSICSYNFQVS